MRRRATSPLVEAPPKKRGRRPREVKEEIIEMNQLGDLLDAVRTYKTHDNRLLCDSFMRAPSRRTNPEYFKVVAHPIDLTRIQQKIKTDEYDSVDELSADMHLLVNNSKAFYRESSQEYKDACKLWEIYDINRKRMFGRELSVDLDQRFTRRSSRNSTTEKDTVDATSLEDIIVHILELTDDCGRLLSPPFRVLPSHEELPMYYEQIKKPIDLRDIARKIRSGGYETWNDFDADIRLLCKNAKTFNETGSIINKDASVILSAYKGRRAALRDTKNRLLNARKVSKNSALIDELLSNNSSYDDKGAISEDAEEVEETEKSDDPKWRLYWAVRNEPNAANPSAKLVDPFLELPSRRYYPDYYDEVTKPMSVYIVNKKLKREEYANPEEVLEDLCQIFENARSYNIEGSDIHESAKYLQNLLESTARSLNCKTARQRKTTRPKKPPRIKSEIKTGADESLTESESKRVPSNGTVVQLEFKKRSGGKPGRKTMYELMECYREKLSALWNVACNHMENNRFIASSFMHLPVDQKYYEFIQRPIDLTMIKEKIDSDQYNTSDEFMADMDLLIHNAWSYYRPDAREYRDATTLQSVVRNALSCIPGAPLLNPIHAKEKYGWLRTKLTTQKHSQSRANAIPANPSYSDFDAEGECSRSSVPSVSNEFNPASPASPVRYMNNTSFDVTSIRAGGPRRSDSNSQKSRKVFMDIYNAVKNCKDNKGRELATPFLQLPSRQEYADYYDVIKKPIDLAKIYERIKNNYYESVDALVSDFFLMFDNACRYNEPESVIYKDALSLQRVVLQMKRDLGIGGSVVPDTQSEVRSILTSILIMVNNHQDAEGRCYSDSLVELPSILKRRGVDASNIPFSLDELRRNIDKGRYRRLDRFQDDLFDLFTVAMENSHSDSQMFEDAAELLLYYITVRDEQLHSSLLSPARWFTERSAIELTDSIRRKKLPEEAKDDEENKKFETLGPKAEGDVDMETVGQGGCVFRVSDYAYVAPASDDAAVERHIMRIERLHRDSDGQTFARGIWCYRPEETFHLATRKFLENEVFLTSYYDTITTDRLIGRCHVMPVRQYMREIPKGFDQKDVYVCEYRYMGRQLHFKKFKNWPFKSEDNNVEYLKREKPVTCLKRVSSVFADRRSSVTGSGTNEGTTHDEESQNSISTLEDDRLKNLPPVLEKERIEVQASGSHPQVSEDGNPSTYYEQMYYNDRWYRRGDFVYVYNPLKNRTAILRIDKMWRTSEGDGFFSGPYFARPREIRHEPARMFYKREVFGVEQPDITVPMENIQGFCAVLTLKDYTKSRPTEINESDVYVVVYKVLGREPANNRCSLTRQENCGGMNSKSTSFETSATPVARAVPDNIHSDAPSTSQGVLEEQSGNTDAVSVSTTVTEDCSDANSLKALKPVSTVKAMCETSAQKLKVLKNYKLSSEVLEPEIFYFKTPLTMEKEMSPLMMHTNNASVPMEPLDDMDETTSESTEVDPTMGKELVAWLAAQPKLNARSKSGYILFSAEIRKRIMQENPEAGFGEVSKIVGVEWKKLSEEDKKQFEVRAEYIASERAKQEASNPPNMRILPGQIRVFICKWQTCDFQFENCEELYEHVKTVHTSQIVDGENQFVCLWASCIKYRKDGKPFPSLPRLHRHIKEKHLATSCKAIYPSQRSKNFIPTYTPPSSAATPSAQTYVAVQQPSGTQVHQAYTISQTPLTYVTQAVVSSHQLVANGYVNGTAVAVAPAAYVATASPTVVHTSVPHGYHPYQQVRQVTASSSQPIAVAGQQHITAVPVHSMNYAAPSTSQQPAITDPGRIVVQAPKSVEPVFVAPPNSVQIKRVMHSEVYLRYIESLSNQQRTVSKWNKSLSDGQHTIPAGQKAAPVQWLKEAKDNGAGEEDLVKALWRLRDSLLESTLNISREVEYVGPL